MIKEFYIAGARYTPAGPVTYCGRAGSLWTLRVLRDGAWRYMGTGFVPGHRPTRSQVIDRMVIDQIPVLFEATDDNI
jgi:hypothetical protein